MELLFERFLSEARGEWPDIDLDLPSGDRREQVIQHVYQRYGTQSAGMTANVITYRGRLAAREVGKALGLPPDVRDRLSKLVSNWGYQDPKDLLVLGMMAVLQDAITLVREQGGEFDLAKLPPDDPAVYAALQKADTVGLFQVESRAQMATLPRIHPERFYDLVVQVAIIRPGPIVGQMVHPYVRRRRGREAVTYPHPALEPILRRTLGVPLFQEQLLRMAMVAAGFTGSE